MGRTEQETTMIHAGHETYYYNRATGERVTATYLVTLVVPSNYFGQIEVEAQSEEEAARLALGKAFEIDWEYPRLALHGSKIEVLDIECDDPPEGAVLQPGGSNANEEAGSNDNRAPIPTKKIDGLE